MKKNIPYFILAALVGAGVLAQNLFSIALQPTPAITASQTAQPATNTPTAVQTNGQCAYMWAYQDTPELATKIETAVHALNPDAKIQVQAYGENCVYSDGSATFGAMETDVYIHTTVEDLTNEEAFGNWMAQVLPLIIQIPENEFPGGYGFVQFWFEKGNGESKVVEVRIHRFLDPEVQKKSGAEFFNVFSVKP